MFSLNKSNVAINKLNLLPDKKSQEQKGYLSSEQSNSANKINLQKPFILIFGTDDETRFLFKTALEIWNYEVAEAENVEQAISNTQLRCPELILMDNEINLSESLTTMKNLQYYNQFKQSGFILISGHALESFRQAALLAGATIFLVKPIDFELFEKSLQIYLENQRQKTMSFAK